VALGDSIFRYITNQAINDGLTGFRAKWARIRQEYEAKLEEWRSEQQVTQSKVLALLKPELPDDEIALIDTNNQTPIARDWDMYKAQIAEHKANLASLPQDQKAEYDLKHKPQQPGKVPDSELENLRDIPTVKLADEVDMLSCGYANGEYGISDFFDVGEEPVFEEEGIDVQYIVRIGSYLAQRSSEYESLKEIQEAKFSASSESTRPYRNEKSGELLYYDSFHFSRSVPAPKLMREARVTIEIKPTIGDDYPAILRQIKQTKAEFILVDRYCGVGATQEQFVQFFQTQGKTVIFEADVNKAVLPTFDRFCDLEKINIT
jgi:hypothetical protein